MKSFAGLTYYDILNIPANSSFIEIKRAYRDVLAIYNDDSLATYALFPSDERDNLLKTIEGAFSTLIDKGKRVAYDRMLVRSGQVDVSILSRQDKKKPIPLFHGKNLTKEDDLVERVKRKYIEKKVKKLSKNILSKDLISGNDLEELRKAIGIEISEIHVVTKVSIAVLKAIENNQFEDLPSGFYLRNFLKSYSEILQIDSQKIIDGYLKNISHVQKNG
jgi:curved DNA-binding protein CbpA